MRICALVPAFNEASQIAKVVGGAIQHVDEVVVIDDGSDDGTAETARAAAFEDSRFLPVTRDEALKLEVSLSVLSLLFPIRPEAVEVGRHGLIVSKGARRGLLLPQVPVEHGWDRETFLEQTCRKAGLPLDAWRKAATIEAFTAEVFGDSDLEVAC